MTETGDESEVYLAHINLGLLTEKNKVNFFDQLSAYTFNSWRLKTVTGITVRKADIQDDDVDE